MTITVFVCLTTTLVQGADLDKSFKETESRRRFAETGLSQIKAKSPQQGEQVRATYTDVANEHNAWWEAVATSITGRAATPPDVSGAAERAAAALVTWVSARNRVLGDPELSGSVADTVKKTVVRDLNDIAMGVWKDHRRSDEKKRSAALASIADGLRWKAWEQVR